jgi:hypothetical protein
LGKIRILVHSFLVIGAGKVPASGTRCLALLDSVELQYGKVLSSKKVSRERSYPEVRI